MRKLISVVFTIERNIHFGQKCIQHLKQNGFIDPILKVYPAAPKGSSNWKLHLSIMENHYNIVRWFTDNYNMDTHDLMICEDDCEFVESNVSCLIYQQLNILHSNFDWSLCLLGQLPCLPIFRTKHDRLTRTICPVLAHCYIFNGTKLNNYLNRIDRRWWTNPFMTEYWFSVPVMEKFAIFPSIATQNRPIKTFKHIPFIRDIPVIKLIHTFEHGMYIAPFLILFVLIVVILYRFVR